MPKMKFVTAIYNQLHGTDFGGRLNRDRHYLYSLKCLANLGAPILCYTSARDKKEIETYLDQNTITNVTLKIYELPTMKHHKKIHEIKQINKELYANDNVWEHRCVEIMWLKLEWLKTESDANVNDKVFWIDAGLSHGGIIPSKFNPFMPEDKGYEKSFQNILAFNGKLIQKLNELTETGLFTFYCNNRQHNYPELYMNDTRLPGSVVAGLFGGTNEQISKMFEASEEIINHVLENNTLLQEEMILTLIYQQYPELFNIFDFDTWYHEDWACYEPSMKSFSAFFEGLL
jgi:hypothetical protein